MIKVLLVEDDKLVRKGLINSFNWEKFNMEVVGEAKDGGKALEFLEGNKIDLLITDLAMPVMSGTELITRVNKEYPNIPVVVLTLHQDFEYIQETMRLGVIDYIAKVELDTENMDKILQRIYKRIEVRNHSYHVTEESNLDGIVIITNSFVKQYKQIVNLFILNERRMFISQKALYVLIEDKDKYEQITNSLQKVLDQEKPILLLKIDKELIINKKDFVDIIQKFNEHIYFYGIEEKSKINVIELNKDYLKQIVWGTFQEKEVIFVREEIKSLKWIFDDDQFLELIERIKNLYLNKHKLYELLVLSILECRKLYSQILKKKIELPVSFEFWLDVVKWFKSIRHSIYETLYPHSIPDETHKSILEAIYLIENNLTNNLTTQEIAQSVHMSRSYFCVCFKEIVGKTVNEYIQEARIMKASYYLKYTKESIASISEKVGYSDSKYFSRVFQKRMGLLPSEYKKDCQSQVGNNIQ